METLTHAHSLMLLRGKNNRYLCSFESRICIIITVQVAFSTAGGTSGQTAAYYNQLGGYWSYPPSAAAAAAAAAGAALTQPHLTGAGAPSYLHQQPYVASPGYGYGYG